MSRWKRKWPVCACNRLGLRRFLSGEKAGMMEPGLGPLQLQVKEEDEADARAILADPGLADSEEGEPNPGAASLPS